MKIAINARLLNERKGGPYRYLVNILTELAEIAQENTYYLILNSVIDQDLKFTAEPNFKQVICPFKNRIIFDYICLPIFSYLNKMDLYFFPKNIFSPLVKGRKIPVFHDIIYFENFKFRNSNILITCIINL